MEQFKNMKKRKEKIIHQNEVLGSMTSLGIVYDTRNIAAYRLKTETTNNVRQPPLDDRRQ